MSRVRIVRRGAIPKSYTPTNKDKVEVGRILNDIVHSGVTVKGDFIPNIFSVSGNTGAKSNIFHTPNFRLDFQGRTANQGYNFQIQTGKNTTAAVIVEKDSFMKVSGKGEHLYVARQIAAALQYSLGDQSIYDIIYVSSFFSHLLTLAKTDISKWSEKKEITSFFPSDTLTSYKQGFLLEHSITQSNKKLNELLEKEPIPVKGENIANINYEYLGSTVDITKLNPFNLVSSINNYSVFTFEKNPSKTTPNGVSYIAKPSSQLTFLSQTMTTSKDVTAEEKNKVTFGTTDNPDAKAAFSSSAENETLSKKITEDDAILTTSNVVCNIGDVRVEDGVKFPFIDEFEHNLTNLNETDSSSISAFLSKYGTHYVNGFSAGGLGEQYVAFSSSLINTILKNKTTYEAESKAFFFNSSFSHTTDKIINDKTTSSVTAGSVTVLGGTELPIPPSHPGTLIDFSGWAKSVYDQSIPMNVKLERYDKLLTTANFPKINNIAKKQVALKSAIDKYLLASINKKTAIKPITSNDGIGFIGFEGDGTPRYLVGKSSGDNTEMTLSHEAITFNQKSSAAFVEKVASINSKQNFITINPVQGSKKGDPLLYTTGPNIKTYEMSLMSYPMFKGPTRNPPYSAPDDVYYQNFDDLESFFYNTGAPIFVDPNPGPITNATGDNTRSLGPIPTTSLEFVKLESISNLVLSKDNNDSLFEGSYVVLQNYESRHYFNGKGFNGTSQQDAIVFRLIKKPSK